MYRILLFIFVSLFIYSCQGQTSINSEKLTIGVVGYDEQAVSMSRYNPLQEYLARKTNSIVEFEPAFNELQALEQIQRKNWSIVFAPPGIAALAMARELYTPMFPLEKINNLERSIIVTQGDNEIDNLQDLSNRTVALGKEGSAAGYYLPLYDLYGLTLAEVIFAPTPKHILELVSTGEAESGALAEYDYEFHRRRDFPDTQFKVLHKSRWIPAGLVLISPTIEYNQQERIKTIMLEAPADIVAQAGYIPSFEIPDYQEFIKLVDKVKPLEQKVRQTPAHLFVSSPQPNN